MDITPQQLNQPEYTMLDRLDHKELIPFVNLYLKKGTFSTRLYYVFNFISLALLLIFFGIAFQQDHLSVSDALTHLCYGFAIAFMLVPLHEWIHALAYKWVGAANTSYDANWKKFSAHPEWKRIVGLPEYANTVSNIHRVFLKPLKYSQL